MRNNALFASISAIVLNKTQFKTQGWIKEVFSETNLLYSLIDLKKIKEGFYKI